MSRKAAALALALALGPSAVAASAGQPDDLKVAARVDKTQVPTGGLLTYSVTIAGPVSETPKVHLTAFDGFNVVSTGQSQSVQVRSGEAVVAVTLSYTLAPTEPGKHVLGPVKVEYKGKEYQTQPIEVTVVEGKARPRREPRRKKQLRPDAPPELQGGILL